MKTFKNILDWIEFIFNCIKNSCCTIYYFITNHFNPICNIIFWILIGLLAPYYLVIFDSFFTFFWKILILLKDILLCLKILIFPSKKLKDMKVFLEENNNLYTFHLDIKTKKLTLIEIKKISLFEQITKNNNENEL